MKQTFLNKHFFSKYSIADFTVDKILLELENVNCVLYLENNTIIKHATTRSLNTGS